MSRSVASVPEGRSAWAVECGDCVGVMQGIPDAAIAVVVTSPPYWGGIRDYGHAGQIGTERDPADYCESLVRVFREVRRILADDGCLWLNVGDVFAASGKGGGGSAGKRSSWDTVRDRKGFRMPPNGYKMKDLTLAPFQVADALRRDGWYMRSVVIWSKGRATEPLRLDRPSQSHEYLFLLAKSEHYGVRNPGESWWGETVWEVQPDVCPDHPATMPHELIRRCLVCSGDGIVCDPFTGSGSTAIVARHLGRRFVGAELNPGYADMARARIGAAAPLFDTIVKREGGDS